MNFIVKNGSVALESPPTPAYDPQNLHPLDEEARRFDDTSDGIDWDEIIATTQDDWDARRFAFSSDDYPDDATAMIAFDRYMDAMLERALAREQARLSKDHAAGR